MSDIAVRLNVIEFADEWVVQCDSPLGRTSQRIAAPFTAEELRGALVEVDRSVERSYSKVVTRRAMPPERVVRQFGLRLADALFAGDVRTVFERCRDRTRQDGTELRLLVQTDGPFVSRIPWEFAVDPRAGDDYLALRLPLARSPRIAEPVPPLAVDPPLRVLGVLSRPADRAQLDVDREQQEITAAFAGLSSELVEVTWLRGDRWRDLATALQRPHWHVLHFVGHGGCDADSGTGYLDFTDDDGNAMKVSATQMARAVARNPQLRLVVLNACESAALGEGATASTAARLMKEGVAAVVAMQYEVTDTAALTFASHFYEALARGEPVDRSMTQARQVVQERLDSLEWATPVLMLASDETRIFDVPARAAAALSTPASTPDAPSAPATPGRGPAGPSAPAGPASVPGAAPATGRPRRSDQPHPDPVTRRSGPADAPPADPPRPPEPRQVPRPPAPRPAALTRQASTPPLGATLHAAVGPRGLVALAGADGVVRVWSPSAGRIVARCGVAGRPVPTQVAWSPWPRHVATIHQDASVVVWDCETEVPVRVGHPGSARLDGLAFAASGRWVAVAGADGRVRVLDAGGTVVRSVAVVAEPQPARPWQPRPTVSLGPLRFAPGDAGVVVVQPDGTVQHYDTHDTVVREWRHPQSVSALAIGADHLATGTVDGRLRVWDWTGHLTCRAEQPVRVDHLDFGPDGRLVSAAGDGTLAVWTLDGRLAATARTAGRPVGLGHAEGGIVTVTERGVVEHWQREVGG